VVLGVTVNDMPLRVLPSGVVSVATTGVSARTAVPVYAPSSVANELPVVNSDTTP
jgi:hypothetical protein